MASGDNITAGNLALAKTPRTATTTATSDWGAATSGTTELATDVATGPVVAGRTYRLKYQFHYAGTVAADRYFVRLREGNGTGGAQLTYHQAVVHATGTPLPGVVELDWVCSSTNASQSFTATYARASGTGTCTPRGASSQPRSLTLEYVSG